MYVVLRRGVDSSLTTAPDRVCSSSAACGRGGVGRGRGRGRDGAREEGGCCVQRVLQFGRVTVEITEQWHLKVLYSYWLGIGHSKDDQTASFHLVTAGLKCPRSIELTQVLLRPLRTWPKTLPFDLKRGFFLFFSYFIGFLRFFSDFFYFPVHYTGFLRLSAIFIIFSCMPQVFYRFLANIYFFNFPFISKDFGHFWFLNY